MNHIPNALDIPIEEYHSDISRISKSGLDKIAKSPAHYYYNYLDPDRERKDAKHYRLGNAAHCAVLEEKDFDNRYITANERGTNNLLSTNKEILEFGEKAGAPVKKSDTKDILIKKIRDAGHELKLYDEYISELGSSGKIILTAEEKKHLQRIRQAVRGHKGARYMLRSGVVEKTFHFTDPNTGAPCKIRPDYYNTADNLIVDLKTTKDASPEGFRRSVAEYRYDVAAALYLDGFKEATGITPDGFVIIAVEKEAPYNVGVYMIEPEAIERGRMLYIRDCTRYMDCKAAGKWPGYSDEIEYIGLPAWAK